MIKELQKEFFQILSEFFVRATGESFDKFSSLDTFNKKIKEKGKRIAPRMAEALNWGVNNILDFYSRNEMAIFAYAKETNGMKLVIGGSSYFTPTHLNAVRKMLLYADTILIPDPIMPWVEVERKDAKFPIIQLLKSIFTLLHLKPLVDADLDYPAIIVFPSFEKRLEEKDPVTRKGIEDLITNLFSYYFGLPFRSVEEIGIFAKEFKEDFLRRVEEKNLFIPPEGTVGMKIKGAIELYKEEIKTWRSENHANIFLNAPEGLLVWNGIYERLTSQFHLLENSNELNSQPMLTLKSHWHYYTLCAEMYQGKLVQSNLLKPQTVNTLKALTEQKFDWLGNVPFNALAKLRENNENEDFRRKISGYVAELHEASLDDLDKVAIQVGRGIQSLIRENKKKVNEIELKYKKLHEQNAFFAWITLGASFFPALAPFAAGGGAISITGRYVWDKFNEYREKKQISQSLIGILAAGKE